MRSREVGVNGKSSRRRTIASSGGSSDERLARRPPERQVATFPSIRVAMEATGFLRVADARIGARPSWSNSGYGRKKNIRARRTTDCGSCQDTVSELDVCAAALRCCQRVQSARQAVNRLQVTLWPRGTTRFARAPLYGWVRHTAATVLFLTE